MSPTLTIKQHFAIGRQAIASWLDHDSFAQEAALGFSTRVLLAPTAVLVVYVSSVLGVLALLIGSTAAFAQLQGAEPYLRRRGRGLMTCLHQNLGCTSLRLRWISTLALLIAVSLPTPSSADKVKVKVEGIGDTLEENVRLTLSIAQLDDPTISRIRSQHGRASEEIREALQPFGYYRPEIDAMLEETEAGEWLATYRIASGDAVRLERVEVRIEGDGAAESGFSKRLADFPLAVGDRVDHSLWENGKAAIEAYGATHGYLDGKFLHKEIGVDLERYSARLELVYDTGPQFFFGPVELRQKVLQPEVIEGYVTFQSGEPFNHRELLALQAALSSSPYFAQVEVVPRRELAGADRQVPIQVRLVPARRQRWTTGIGYGSDTELRFGLALDLRRINSRGHRGVVDLELSAIESTGEVRYLIPGPYPRTDEISIGAGYSEVSSDTVDSSSRLLSLGRTQTRRGWRESLSLSYTLEDYEVGLDSGQVEIVAPRFAWTRVIADDRIYPHRGYRLQTSLSIADDELLSDVTFAQLELSGKIVRAIGPDMRAILRLASGYTETPTFRQLPPSIRFFAGGDESVRGYAYQSLGELDASDQVIGGQALLEASLEIDWLFYDRFGRWGLAAFYDAGNATFDFTSDLRRGAGGGLRWLSPVGMVRADIAWPLNPEPGSGDSPTLHISLGPDL